MGTSSLGGVGLDEVEGGAADSSCVVMITGGNDMLNHAPCGGNRVVRLLARIYVLILCWSKAMKNGVRGRGMLDDRRGDSASDM